MATGMALGLALGNGGGGIAALILLLLIVGVVFVVWAHSRFKDWQYHRWLRKADEGLDARERRIADLTFGSRKLLWKSVRTKP